MRPAQKAPENELRVAALGRRAAASMRPAQKAPENDEAALSVARKNGSFNEAGAKSAGKREDTVIGITVNFWLQ